MSVKNNNLFFYGFYTTDYIFSKTWQDPPYPIFTDYYVFNCTNYDEVLAGAKPIVKELGPYSYRYPINSIK